MASLNQRLIQPEEQEAWDETERSEIISYVAIDVEAQLKYQMEKAGIMEGCCFEVNNFLTPFRWIDSEKQARSVHLAVSAQNVMYMTLMYPKHVLNPCPPCCCFNPGSYREDRMPKTRKFIPLEKITDIEVMEAGANELVMPPCCGCTCPPQCNPVSIELPVSKAFVNTAGSNGSELIIDGIQDANGFRRLVNDLKHRAKASVPGQEVMASSTPGESKEMVSLLREIASSNREIVDLLKLERT